MNHVCMPPIRPVDVRGELRPDCSSAAAPSASPSAAAVRGGVQSDPRDWDRWKFKPSDFVGQRGVFEPIFPDWPGWKRLRNPHDWQPGEVPVKIIVDNPARK